MGDVLSQSEIDSLLRALSDGELDVDEMKDAPEKQVKNYDFARPSKFSKEHVRTLEIIFEHYGRFHINNTKQNRIGKRIGKFRIRNGFGAHYFYLNAFPQINRKIGG